jgi:hypothetical protein
VQLARAIALVALAAGTARAQPADGDRRATGSLRVYADDDHMTIVSPHAGARAAIGDRATVEAAATADVISGASVDVISEASPTAIDETRVEGTLGISYAVTRTARLRARGTGSHENDYDSVGGELGGAVELAQRNTTVDLAARARADRVGRADDPSVEHARSSQQLTLTVTQLIDRASLIDLVVEGTRDAGYMASPYRTVPLIDPASPALMRVPEEVPRRRRSLAAMVRLRRAFGSRLFGHGSVRYVRDDWSIDSVTGTLSLLTSPIARLRLGGQLRLYAQDGADFYQPRYQLEDGAVPDYRTRDRRLGTMQSAHVTATSDLAITGAADGPRLVTAAGVAGFRFPDFPAQRRRLALILTVALSSSF